ncbi:50S ribosomal protein L5 [Rhabdochlamydiaceae symbiont of Dictyostelium giganteum]|uniref:50S ribosomal protein L5 n=1 Tax=Rhabdochlamydiaceae symbiont of Dictyostelium giganteum TaxID=3342349 RepID=UPI00384D02A2
MTRLLKRYKEEVRPALNEKFGYANPMLIPSLKKIVISMGLAEATKDKNALQDCFRELTQLSGQKPIFTRTKKAISNFKSRLDQIIGLKVTLRRERMFDFLDRFCNIVAPRIKDFRGFSVKGDGRGSYSLGLDDQQVFPEINLDEVKRTQGMNITFVTSAKIDEECVELLRMLGLPFKTQGK